MLDSIATLLNGVKHLIDKKIDKPLREAEENQFLGNENGTPKWKTVIVPTKISQLINDSNFIKRPDVELMIPKVNIDYLSPTTIRNEIPKVNIDYLSPTTIRNEISTAIGNAIGGYY